MTATATIHPDDAALLAAGKACMEAALEYLAIGWAAVPVCDPHHAGERAHAKSTNCKTPGKVPVCKWAPIIAGNRLRADELKSFWQYHPTRNVGLICGAVSGVVAIDVDGERGSQSLLDASGGDLPETVEFPTPGGGRRLIYAIPAGAKLRTTHREMFKEAKHEGLSYLAEGGHTVLPPSRHASGGRYTWAPGKSILQRAPALAPAWLIDKLKVDPTEPASNGHAIAESGEAGDYPPYDARLLFACGFMRHWRDDAPRLSEPEWLIGIRTAAHAINGREVVHECSRNYDGYTPEETDRKFEQSTQQKPRTCANIESETGGVWCRACPVRGEIHSPVTLAVVDDRADEPTPSVSSAPPADAPRAAGSNGAHTPEMDAFQNRRKEKARKRVSKALGVGELVRVVQFGRENASFELTFRSKSGEFTVAVASMEQLAQQGKVQARIAEKFGRYPHGVEREKWLRLVNDILQLREVRDTGSTQETVADWIAEYIAENDRAHCAFDEPGVRLEDAANWKKMKSFRSATGDCYISLNAFQEWMSFKRLAIKQNDLTKALVKLKFRKKKVRKLGRRFWVNKSWFRRGKK